MSSANNDLLMLDNERRMHVWSYGRKDLQKEHARIAEKIGLNLDIAATWHSSLNVCQASLHFVSRVNGSDMSVVS